MSTASTPASSYHLPPTPVFSQSTADDYVFGAESDDDAEVLDLEPPSTSAGNQQPQQQQQRSPQAPLPAFPQPQSNYPHPPSAESSSAPALHPFTFSSLAQGSPFASSSAHHPFNSQSGHVPTSGNGNFHAYRSPAAQHGLHQSPTFSDASTTVSPRDVFGDDRIMKKTYPSLFGRAGGNGAISAASSSNGAGGSSAGRGTMGPTQDHVAAGPASSSSSHHLPAHLQGRNHVFHSPLSVDSTNTTSPRAIFAPIQTLRSADSYLSTSSEEEDEVPSPIILPEPQSRPSTSAPHASSMHYFGFPPGAAAVAQQASPAMSEGAGLGRELTKVDFGFRPLTNVDRFKASEESGGGPVAPSSRTVAEMDDGGSTSRPPGPGLGKTAPGGGVFPTQSHHQPPYDDDDDDDDDNDGESRAPEGGGVDSPRSTTADSYANDDAIDIDVDGLPTSSDDSDDMIGDAPYTGKGRPLSAAALARRAALGLPNRGGAARRGARGGKAPTGVGFGRAVRGSSKSKAKAPRASIMSRGVSKIRNASTSASSSGRASPSGEITYCPYVDPVTKKPCSASFVRFYDLKRHEETVHSMPPASTNAPGSARTSGSAGKPGGSAGAAIGFWCERCDKPFSRKDALIRHQKTIPDCWKNKGKPGKAKR